jgi:DNA-binding CsgD family transcriptional regulator
LRLYELTGETGWRDRAREKHKNYAGSWLYDELRAQAASDAPFLHPAQKRVYDLLLEGNSTEQIAKITGRSPFTISNQVKAILRAFGVPNRGALLADAMKRGPVSGTRRRK